MKILVHILSIPLLSWLAFGQAAPASGQDVPSDDVKGVVYDEKGEPLADVKVVLDMGRIHFVLGKEYDRWSSLKTKKGKTDSEGRFSFEGLPKGTLASVHVEKGKAFGIAKGTGELEVRLGPLGAVRGMVVGRKKRLRGLRVYVRGGNGFGGEEGVVDEDRRFFEVSGLPPGEARVFVMRSNFTVACADVVIKAGKTSTVKPIRIGDGFLTGADPLVDCTKAKLIDGRGRPVSGVQLIWSSQWMDGGMGSDEKGIVRLAGGGVAIGSPPYLLRLRTLRGKTDSFYGVFRRVVSGCALVELRKAQTVMGTVKEGGEAIKEYQLLVVGPGKTPHVYYGNVENGRYSVDVPEGKCLFVVGTADGKIHEKKIEVVPTKEEAIHEIVIGK